MANLEIKIDDALAQRFEEISSAKDMDELLKLVDISELKDLQEIAQETGLIDDPEVKKFLSALSKQNTPKTASATAGGGKPKTASATVGGGKRLTQTEIVNSLAEATGLKKTEVKNFFDVLSGLAAGEVKSNGEFTLPGFGKLVLTRRKARHGRNPATGTTIKIPAKRTVKFRVGKAMKDAID